MTTYNQLIRSEIPLGIDYHGTPTERLQRLFQDCGVDPVQVQSLMSELPPQPLATDLVDWFFNKINFVRYPIAEDLFRRGQFLAYREYVAYRQLLACSTSRAILKPYQSSRSPWHSSCLPWQFALRRLSGSDRKSDAAPIVSRCTGTVSVGLPA